ncbi:MAG: penicillin acylase family protein, partial [Actinomycetota bacterium]
ADLSDPSAVLINSHCPTSGHPASPHFADLVPLWAAGDHHPMPFTRGAVESAAEATLRLVPSSS